MKDKGPVIVVVLIVLALILGYFGWTRYSASTSSTAGVESGAKQLEEESKKRGLPAAPPSNDVVTMGKK